MIFVRSRNSLSTRVAAAWGVAAIVIGPGIALAQNARFFYATPAPSTFEVLEDVAYTRSSGSEVRMDVYRPKSAAAGSRLPALIFLNTLAARPQREHDLYRGWAAATTANGMVAVLPDAASDFSTGFDSLLAYLRRNAAELRIDPNRVAVYAASGNVSGALPVLENPARSGVAAAVLYYGVGAAAVFRPDLPILFVRAGLDRPGLNEELDALVAAALRSNAPVQVINHASGHHAFEMRDDTDATRDVIEKTFQFVAAATDPRQQEALRAGIPEARAAGAVLRGDYATAVTTYAEIVAARPDDVHLRLAYGEALLGAGRVREARFQFDSLKDRGLGYRDLGLPAARAALADGDPEGAVAWLRTIPSRFLPPSLVDDPGFAALRERPDFKALFE